MSEAKIYKVQKSTKKAPHPNAWVKGVSYVTDNGYLWSWKMFKLEGFKVSLFKQVKGNMLILKCFKPLS